LTHTDRTIPDAADRVTDALRAGVRHIGFKDVGLSFAGLRRLAHTIRAAGATLYLEVVSLDAQSEEASARAAVELGVDVLMGGTRPEMVLPVLAGTGIRYYPFPGQVVSYPSVLVGTTDAVVESARQLAAMDGVYGLDLLAYRFQGDVPDLIGQVCRAVVPKPVVVAGSIDRPAAGCFRHRGRSGWFYRWHGSADGIFPAHSSALADQLAFIVQRASSRPKPLDRA
jgi:4-hydroxythreonine-4-phosphate dehydrogenase